MALLSIEALRFKGTHNSYDDRRVVPPPVQIDHFGAWALELDYSVAADGGGRPRAVVGHDGVGRAADGRAVIGYDPAPNPNTDEERYRLQYYLQQINETRSLRYRPVFLFLEKKRWGDRDDREDDVRFDDPGTLLELLRQELQLFGEKVCGPDWFGQYAAEHAGRYPSAPELAGKVVPIAIAEPFRFPGPGFIFNVGTEPGKVFRLNGGIATGCDGLDEIPETAKANHIVRVDNHQADRSFGFGVPPNPLVVEFDARRETTVRGCGIEFIANITEDVHEQGTYAFPYRDILKAVGRARGVVPTPPREQPQELRSGLGWTILIKPGAYRERAVIDIPLVLAKDERYSNNVLIGQR